MQPPSGTNPAKGMPLRTRLAYSDQIGSFRAPQKALLLADATRRRSLHKRTVSQNKSVALIRLPALDARAGKRGIASYPVLAQSRLDILQ